LFAAFRSDGRENFRRAVDPPLSTALPSATMPSLRMASRMTAKAVPSGLLVAADEVIE
jgi:hypothetical protein